MKNFTLGTITLNSVISLLLLASCGKNNDPTPVSKKLYSGTQTSQTSNSSFTLQYNSDGKLDKLSSSITSGNSTYTQTLSYAYSSNQITENESSVYNGQNSSVSAKYSLNSQGYVSAKVGNSYSTEYTYNSNGNLTSKTEKNGTSITSTTTYTWTDGNLTSETETYSGGSNTTTYEYYTDKPNSYTNDNVGRPFLGKSGKNQIKKSVLTSGSAVLTETYTYEFDSDNFITKETRVSNIGNNSYTYVTTYVWK